MYFTMEGMNELQCIQTITFTLRKKKYLCLKSFVACLKGFIIILTTILSRVKKIFFIVYFWVEFGLIYLKELMVCRYQEKCQGLVFLKNKIM